jgi:hypothetical protein
MHTYYNIINITLLAFGCPNMFRLSNGVQLIHFHSQINNVRTRC